MYFQRLVFLILIISSQAAFSLSLEEKIDLFQKFCVGENQSYKLEAVIESHNISCSDLAQELKNDIAQYESQNPDNGSSLSSESLTLCGTDAGDVETREIDKLLSDATKITGRISCEKEEVEKNKKICGKLFTCNVMRSLSSATTHVLPEFLANKIDKSLQNRVEKNNLPKDCLDSSKGDCLSEFVTSFVGNLWSTVTSVWDLAKAGASSLFNVSKWFDKKSESAHALAVQSEEAVTSFTSDPVGYIQAKMNSMKEFVNTFIKTSVFCQKWEGVPHFSECAIPLQSYDCLDCDHGINAVCTTLGALTSEVGVMFLTAGVGNTASLAVKIGARALTNVASKVKKVMPAINAGQLAVEAEVEMTKLAKVQRAYDKSKDVALALHKKVKDAKAQITEFVDKVAEMKYVAGTLKVVDTVTNPFNVSEKVSRLGVNASNRVLQHVGTDSSKRFARVSLRMDERYETSRMVERVLDKRDNHTTRNFAMRSARASKTAKSVSEEVRHLSNSHMTPPTSNRRGTISRDGSRDVSDHFKPEHSSNNKSQTTQSTTPEKKAGRTTDGKREGVEVSVEKPSKEKSKSAGSDHKVSSDHAKKEGEKKEGTSLSGANALGAMAIADVTHKLTQSEKDMLARDTSVAGLEKAKDILGANSIAQMKQNAEKLSEMYSDKNKEQIVEKLVNETGVSKAAAEQIYNNRREEVVAAKNYIANQSDVSSSGESRSAAVRDVSSFSEKSELERMAKDIKSSPLTQKEKEFNSKKDALEKRLERLSEKFDDQSNSNNDGQEVSGRRESRGSSVARNQRNPASTGGGSLASASSASGRSSSSSSSSSSTSSNSGTGEVNPLLGNALSAINKGEGSDATSAEGVVREDGVVELAKAEKMTDLENATELEKTYQTSAITNLLKMVNQENVEMVNDFKVTFDDITYDESINKVYAQRALSFVNNESVAKFKISKTLKDKSVVEIYEFDGGEQFSFINDGSGHRLIANEVSSELVK